MFGNNKTNPSIWLSGERFDHKGIEGGRKGGAEVWFFIETITRYYNVTGWIIFLQKVFPEVVEIIKTAISTNTYALQSICCPSHEKLPKVITLYHLSRVSIKLHYLLIIKQINKLWGMFIWKEGDIFVYQTIYLFFKNQGREGEGKHKILSRNSDVWYFIVNVLIQIRIAKTGGRSDNLSYSRLDDCSTWSG